MQGKFRGTQGLFTDQYGDGSKPCTPVVHIKIAGKWMFIPLKMVCIGIDPQPYENGLSAFPLRLIL